MRIRKRRWCLGMAMGIGASVGFCPRRAWGVIHSWVGSSGSFNNASNWSGSIVPGTNDTANFVRDLSYQVSFPSGATTTNLTANIEAGTLQFDLNHGTYTLSSGLSIAATTASGAAVFVFDGTINSTSTAIGSASDGIATLAAGGNMIATSLTVGGSPGISGSLVVLPGGAGTIENGALGVVPGAVGIAQVMGGDLQFSNSLFLGELGTGSCQISASGSVSAGSLIIGLQSGSQGTLAVDSQGGFISLGNSTIGGFGSGTVNVSGGGQVALGSVTLASQLGSTSNISLSGAGSLFEANDLDFGLGEAVITINDGAALTVVNNATLNHAGAEIDLNGGSVSIGRLLLTGGTLNFASGTLQITGNSGTFETFNLNTSGNKLFIGPTQHLFVPNETLSISSEHLLEVNGGDVRGEIIANSGEIRSDSLLSTIDGGQIINDGLVDGTGSFNTTTVLNDPAGEIRAAAGERLVFGNSNITNAGRMTLLGGTIEAGIQNGSPIVNDATGVITGRGTLIAHAGILNSGSIIFSAGLSDILGSIENSSGGKIITTGGATATFYNPIDNQAGSEFRVSAGSTAVFLAPVTGTSQFTGTGVKDFEASATPGPIASIVGDTFIGAGATVNATFIREDQLTVDGIASVIPNGAAANFSRVATLILDPGGKLDLNDNDLIIDNSSLPAVQSQIKSAFTGGSWQGSGLTSSTAAATSLTAHPTALGYARASDLGLLSFDGQSVNPSSLLVRYTAAGDANLDGKVNALDFNALATNFGGRSGGFWYQGDFNYDGAVTTSDFTLLAQNFSQALASPTVASAVPEPAASFGCIGMLALALRKRRKAH